MPRPVLEDTMNSSAMFEQCSSTVIDVLKPCILHGKPTPLGNGSEPDAPSILGAGSCVRSLMVGILHTLVQFSGLTRHRTSVRIWSCVRVSLGQIWRAHDRARRNGEMEGGVWLWRQCRLAQGAQQAQRARKPARARTVRSSSKGDDQRLLPEPGDQKGAADRTRWFAGS